MLLLFVRTVPDDWPQHLLHVHFVVFDLGPSVESLTLDQYRTSVYLCFLQAAIAVTRVTMIDTRDVVFGGDPFAVYTDNLLHFFAESALSIGQEKFNRRWVLECSPSLNLTETKTHHLLGMPVLNSGTIIGPSHGMQHFLTTMSAAMQHFQDVASCADQGVLNILVWRGHFRLPPFRTESPEVGSWLTVGLQESHHTTYAISDSKVISKATGRAYVAVHQYDRVPELVAHFRRLYPAE
jgi:hypothetical protein